MDERDPSHRPDADFPAAMMMRWVHRQLSAGELPGVDALLATGLPERPAVAAAQGHRAA